MPTRRLTIVLLVALVALAAASFTAGSWTRSAQSARSAQDGATPDLLARVHASQTAAATATAQAREQAARDATATAVTNGQVLAGTLDRLSPELIDDRLATAYLDETYLPDPFYGLFFGEVYKYGGTADFWDAIAPDLEGATFGALYGFGWNQYPPPFRDSYDSDWQVYLTIDRFSTAYEALAAMESWGQFEVDAVPDANGLPALVGTRLYGDPSYYDRERVSVARFQVGPLVVSGVVSRTIEDGDPLGSLYQPEAEVAAVFAGAGIAFLTDVFVGAIETAPLAPEGMLTAGTPAGATPILVDGTPVGATPILVGGTPGAATPVAVVGTPAPGDRAATIAAVIESTATARSATATQAAINDATQAAVSTQAAATQDALATEAVSTRLAQTRIATEVAAQTRAAATSASQTRVADIRSTGTAAAVTRTAAVGVSAASTRTARTYQTATSVVSTRAASTAVASGISTQAAMASQTRMAGTQSASTATVVAGVAPPASSDEVVLVINDGQFVPETSTVVRGQAVVLINAGSEPCNFVVVGFNDRNPVRVPVDRTVEWAPPPAVGLGTHSVGCVYGLSPTPNAASITIIEP